MSKAIALITNWLRTEAKYCAALLWSTGRYWKLDEPCYTGALEFPRSGNAREAKRASSHRSQVHGQETGYLYKGRKRDCRCYAVLTRTQHDLLSRCFARIPSPWCCFHSHGWSSYQFRQNKRNLGIYFPCWRWKRNRPKSIVWKIPFVSRWWLPRI